MSPSKPCEIWIGPLQPGMQAALEQLGNDHASVIRRALSVYVWMHRERQQGSRFLIQRGDKVTEFVEPTDAR